MFGAATLVLDGGLATELERQGHDLSGALWSARILRDEPDAVVAVHAAYFAAGAQVATTASYQETDPAMLARSVALAREAVDAHGSGWVAASVGPYGAVRADGSEYTGAYDRDESGLRAFHRPRLDALAAAGPDLLACETVPSLAEVAALLVELDDLGVPAWLSLTVDGDRLRTGEPVGLAWEHARDVDAVVAVGVNCCRPGDVAAAVHTAAQVSGKPVVAYPNSGEGWDAVGRRWTGPAAFAADMVRDWLAAGAAAVGGCCRVGPAEIAAIAAVVREDG